MMLRITGAAKVLGVCPNRLRRLECAADGTRFIAQRDIAGQRRYSAEDIATLRRIFYPSASSCATTASHAATATEVNAHGA